MKMTIETGALKILHRNAMILGDFFALARNTEKYITIGIDIGAAQLISVSLIRLRNTTVTSIGKLKARENIQISLLLKVLTSVLRFLPEVRTVRQFLNIEAAKTKKTRGLRRAN